MMDTYIDNWKNKDIFKQQLAINLVDLGSQYPKHWEVFLTFLDKIAAEIRLESILDIGCGCGAFAELIRRYNQNIKYTGCDYAQEAIDVASKQWPYASFFKKDYQDLSKSETDKYSVLHAGSLHTALIDGNACIKFLLQLAPKYLILGRVSIDTDSHVKLSNSYGVQTYHFYHSYTDLFKIFDEANYRYIEGKITEQFTNYLLIKK